MAQRRATGEGSIYREAGGRWVALLELPRLPNGKRNRKKLRSRTRAEAVRNLRQLKQQYEETPDADPTRTIAETLDDYVEQVRAPAGRSRKATERDDLFRRAIVEFMGRRRTLELSVQDCDAFLAAFIAGELTGGDHSAVSREYGRRARSFLANALRNDIRQGYLAKNVAEVAVIPASSAQSKERRALSVEEWRQLIGHARGAVQVGIDLGGRHGLRPQEARAVRWSEVDWDRRTLSVVTQFDADDEHVDTKTVGSTRTIRLHPETVDLLDRWRKAQRRGQGVGSVDDGLVVATRRGGPIQQSNYRRALREACARAGIDAITPYELRHTAITHQIESGRSATQVADWAGTSERMIYKHYRHKLREVVEVDPLDYS